MLIIFLFHKIVVTTIISHKSQNTDYQGIVKN